jgi:hypothetical protein
MSEADFYDEDDSFEEPTTQRNPLRDRNKQLEKELAAKAAEASEAQAAKRELAFYKAGIPLDSPMSSYFIKAYDGDLTPEAIKQAAEAAQLISSPDAIPQDETNAWNRTNNVATGSLTSTPPMDMAQRIANAANSDEVMAILAEAQN